MCCFDKGVRLYDQTSHKLPTIHYSMKEQVQGYLADDVPEPDTSL